jgi:DUF1680 family protein
MFDQAAKYMDHYERGLYNHILASVAENDPGNTYHVPLNPGAQKQFGNADMSGFSCCNGTALESSTKLQDSIYFRGADNRAIFGASERDLEVGRSPRCSRRPLDLEFLTPVRGRDILNL